MIDRMVGSAERRLQVAQYRVDPTELGTLHGVRAGDDQTRLSGVFGLRSHAMQ